MAFTTNGIREIVCSWAADHHFRKQYGELFSWEFNKVWNQYIHSETHSPDAYKKEKKISVMYDCGLYWICNPIISFEQKIEKTFQWQIYIYYIVWIWETLVAIDHMLLLLLPHRISCIRVNSNRNCKDVEPYASYSWWEMIKDIYIHKKHF